MATEHTESTDMFLAAHALRAALKNTRHFFRAFRVFRGYYRKSDRRNET